MRADEAIERWENLCCHLKGVGVLDYINQLRYERLMAKAIIFWDKADLFRKMRNQCRYDEAEFAEEYLEKCRKCRRISKAYEARANKIKEGM